VGAGPFSEVDGAEGPVPDVRVIGDRVHATGDVDRAVATRIGAVLSEAGLVAIDLSHVSLIDSDAIAVLAALHRRDPNVRIVAASPIVRRALTMTRANDLLTTTADPVDEGPGSGIVDCSAADDRIVVQGEIDAATIGIVMSVIAEHRHLHRIDLTAVTFIDSSGLRGLVEARRRDPQFYVCAASHNARRVLELTGLEYLLRQG
jgi:anti-anti-sigma factor